MRNFVLVEDLLNALKAIKCPMDWRNGVKLYAIELVESLEEMGYKKIDLSRENWKTRLEENLLNGADDWEMYSRGGCSLIWNEDICRRVCTEASAKRAEYGKQSPRIGKDWLDVQARALYQAFKLIVEKIEEM